MLAQETLVTVLSFQLRIPVVDLRHVQVDPEAVRLVPEDYARQYGVMPTGFDTDGSLRIATRMPNDFQLSSELSSVTGRQTKFVLAIGGRLEELIDKVYSNSATPMGATDGEAQTPAAALAPVEAPPSGTTFGQSLSQLPAVQAVDMVTLQAVKSNASDIHMVPSSDSARVLFRLDGTLHQMVVLPLTLHETMLSRIKVQAGMDISETRRPQDGSFSMMFGERKAEFRVSSVGTTWGEMMVIRVLAQTGELINLEGLGLDSQALPLWRQLLSLPYGILLVSGPTGSGKTTTMYASVAELVNQRGNIMSVEDPIEYRMEGVNQIQVVSIQALDSAAQFETKIVGSSFETTKFVGTTRTVSATRIVAYQVGGKPKVLSGANSLGGVAELTVDDGSYYRLSAFDNSQQLSYRASSETIGFSRVEFAEVKVKVRAWEETAKVEVFVFNDDPALNPNVPVNPWVLAASNVVDHHHALDADLDVNHSHSTDHESEDHSHDTVDGVDHGHGTGAASHGHKDHHHHDHGSTKRRGPPRRCPRPAPRPPR